MNMIAFIGLVGLFVGNQFDFRLLAGYSFAFLMLGFILLFCYEGKTE